MPALAERANVLKQLRQEILLLQGFRAAANERPVTTGLDFIEKSFPGQVFPRGAIHEFISYQSEDATATNGFIAALIRRLVPQNGACVWVSNRRNIFPPALALFGIAPERVVFVDLNRESEVLWAIEEALKCSALAVVVGELKELSFINSRRLQLAVEQSRVTGLIHRYRPRSENTVACVSRWKIAPIASVAQDAMPGLDFPRWRVALLKARNGVPGNWHVEWNGDNLQILSQQIISAPDSYKRKTG